MSDASRNQDLIHIQKIVNKCISKDLFTTNDKMGWVQRAIHGKRPKLSHSTNIKIGTYLEKIIISIARNTYGERRVPFYYAGYGVSEQQAKEYFERGQGKNYDYPNAIRILSLIDKNKVKKIVGDLDTFVKENGSLGRSNMLMMYDKLMRENIKGDVIIEINADLIIDNGDTFCIYEAKTSGDTDPGKTANTVLEQMILPYLACGVRDANVYFGIISGNKGNYIKTGEPKLPAIKKYISKENILFEDAFFQHFLPNGVNADEFKDIVIKCIANRKK